MPLPFIFDVFHLSKIKHKNKQQSIFDRKQGIAVRSPHLPNKSVRQFLTGDMEHHYYTRVESSIMPPKPLFD